MPYGCTVVALDGVTVTLEVEPEQPDAEPFYTAPAFALALLIDAPESVLARSLGGDEALDRLAAGEVDAGPWIAAVAVTIVRRGRRYDEPGPLARYRITVTDRRHRAHLRPGQRYDSYAWLEAPDPVIPDEDVFEADVPVAVGTYPIGARIALYPSLAISPGTTCGRGVVEATATARRRPPGWTGGDRCHRIALDHGLTVWAFAETLRPAPGDTYERAWHDPARFVTELLARTPLARAEALRFLALRGGGDLRLTGFDGAIAMRSPWMFGLLRRLPPLHALEVGTRLLADWTADPIGCATRLGATIVGVELAAPDVIEGHHLAYCCPIELVLGGLTMLLAERPTSVPDPATLRRALDALPGLGFGYAARAWQARTAYLRAACDGVAPPLPSLFAADVGERGRELARALGLEGGVLVGPSVADLYRP